MGLLAFMARVAGVDANAYERQALATFGADANPNTPRSTGTTECDDVGVSVGPTAAPTANTLPNVTPASSVVLAANAQRRGVIFYNASDHRLWLTLGDTAVVNTGIPLEPGEKWTFTQPRNARYVGPIAAIHDGVGNKPLSVNPW